MPKEPKDHVLTPFRTLVLIVFIWLFFRKQMNEEE